MHEENVLILPAFFLNLCRYRAKENINGSRKYGKLIPKYSNI